MDADATGLISASTLRSLLVAVESPDADALARAALLIARIEHPRLDVEAYLTRLHELGARAAERLAGIDPSHVAERVSALNTFLYGEVGLQGNERFYDDPRNSFINDVLDRRTGIPISLAVVYMAIARRAGVAAAGINFPGHFLIRCPIHSLHDLTADDLIVDAFNAGTLLAEGDCRRLLRKHAGDDTPFHDRLLVPTTTRAIVVRMLVNLKRVYVKLRSFPHARSAAHLLLQVEPSASTELRDRGLLAYHMNDYTNALRDLERYLQLTSRGSSEEPDHDTRAEYEQVWEHVKALRRRVASLN
ncbi:MAG: transglutaminase-like domain-containing protein [Vicinamibacterales bacterium]